jgi:hypothetical protein
MLDQDRSGSVPSLHVHVFRDGFRKALRAVKTPNEAPNLADEGAETAAHPGSCYGCLLPRRCHRLRHAVGTHRAQPRQSFLASQHLECPKCQTWPKSCLALPGRLLFRHSQVATYRSQPHTSPGLGSTTPDCPQHACRLGLEGIVSKRLSAPYRSGRSTDWLKIKNPNSPAMVRVREREW